MGGGVRVADVARVVGAAGGPSAYVERVLTDHPPQGGQGVGPLMDAVALSGGLVTFAANAVAARLAVDVADTCGLVDLTLAMDHARALLCAVSMDDLAAWVAEGVAVP